MTKARMIFAFSGYGCTGGPMLTLLALASFEPVAHADRANWLRVDPSAPFERVSMAPERRARLGEGAVRIRVPGLEGAVELDAAPAAVLTLRPGAPVPAGLRETGVPLGRTERSWRVSVPPGSGQDALDLALEWSEHPAVQSAMPDIRYGHERMVEFDDPELGAQWYLDLLAFDAMASRTLGDPQVRVAVIDGAIDIGHADLAAGVDSPWDVIDEDDDPSPVPGELCDEGVVEICDDHGTSTSGIIAARSNNAVDIVGLCSECTLIPIRLLGPGNGFGLAEDIAAFEHAIDSDAWVVNNSWGFTEAIAVPAPLADVIERTMVEPRDGLGAVVVFAAGNDDRELHPDEMTGIPGVLTVSATDRYGFATNFTNIGSTVDIAAPSATVTLAAGGGLNTTYGGTSAAAPVVSGIAAWTLSYRPELSASEVADLLVRTARSAGEPGEHTAEFGYGHIDPENLIAELEGTNEPDVEDVPRACASASGMAGIGALLPLLLVLVRRRR
jgi:subtilisin family serine protease